MLGASMSEKHPAYRNMCKLQNGIKSIQDADTPAGNHWQGIVNEYEQDLNSKANKRYIWSLRMHDPLKIVITMHLFLAALIHTALFIVCDFTFKRVRGDLNEWEVAIWHQATLQCVTIARIYSNGQDADALSLFEDFFTAVHAVTQKPIQFKVFKPDTGNLLSINMDMEVAQVQGLGQALLQLKINHPEVSGINEDDPDILVQYILKLCSVHLCRSLDCIQSAVGTEAVEHLILISSLKDPNAIQEWH
ncbi:hypothetical protein BDN71DRAFT_1508923 [Pleurotus eryngii]|uniref:Uncharacterized protein n=1 Tax=Pleurotus eryngii TaxID=5323 RepID=A0A9P6D6J6_PLEER|nr:hypothetical protein BDN71DRAFT_1508923 [Pleurotus eryngii]